MRGYFAVLMLGALTIAAGLVSSQAKANVMYPCEKIASEALQASDSSIRAIPKNHCDEKIEDGGELGLIRVCNLVTAAPVREFVVLVSADCSKQVGIIREITNTPPATAAETE